MKNFLVGLGIGVGLGILFAPRSGEETRTNLSSRANDLANSARESYAQNRERIQRGVENIRGKAERAVNAVRSGASTTSEQMRATGTEPPGSNI